MVNYNTDDVNGLGDHRASRPDAVSPLHRVRHRRDHEEGADDGQHGGDQVTHGVDL